MTRHQGRHAAARLRTASDSVRNVSFVKKVLLSLMTVGALSSAVGAGTFAAFTSTTQNSSELFATGSLVLSNQKASATACLSTGGGTSTDSNANTNTGCDVIFDADNETASSSRHPGDSNSVVMHLKNAGTLSGTLSASSQTSCASTDPADQPIWGTSDACNVVQLSIQDSSQCYWGDNMGTSTTKPYITGAPLTYPLTITTSSNRFKLTVDGVAYDNIQLAAGTYNTAALFAAQIQTKVTAAGSSATVSATSSGQIRITSNTATPSSNVSLAIPSASLSTTGLATMGFMDGASASAPGVCATKTGDLDHTLADFRTTTSTTPLALGTLSSLSTRDFTVTLSVAAVIGDQMQGRKTGFDLTWSMLS